MVFCVVMMKTLIWENIVGTSFWRVAVSTVRSSTPQVFTINDPILATPQGTTTAYGNNSSSGLGKLAQIRQTRQKKKQHQVRGLEHYAPTKNKARGDVKRKGQTLDPYAYVALNPKLVKEKFKAKSMQSFANVVGKAPERGAKAKRVMNTRMKKAGVKKKGGKAKKSR